MSTKTQRPTAQILAFPARTRGEANAPRLNPEPDLDLKPAVAVGTGSAWYHELAIANAVPPPTSR